MGSNRLALIDLLEKFCHGGRDQGGFLSAFLVAKKVTITSKHNDEVEYLWESQGGDSFTVSSKVHRGTEVTLFLKDGVADELDLLKSFMIKYMVNECCKDCPFPVYLLTKKTENRNGNSDVQEEDDEHLEELKHRRLLKGKAKAVRLYVKSLDPCLDLDGVCLAKYVANVDSNYSVGHCIHLLHSEGLVENKAPGSDDVQSEEKDCDQVFLFSVVGQQRLYGTVLYDLQSGVQPRESALQLRKVTYPPQLPQSFVDNPPYVQAPPQLPQPFVDNPPFVQAPPQLPQPFVDNPPYVQAPPQLPQPFVDNPSPPQLPQPFVDNPPYVQAPPQFPQPSDDNPGNLLPAPNIEEEDGDPNWGFKGFWTGKDEDDLDGKTDWDPDESSSNSW
ncbi:OLC1v1027084C1 [Oldenlandia corymbosa var. corymbosa]|uniref:OLC1v1027084C1 n=1 Tax=Oldenlandia corymbosa var. corymbosa TaxID=529605 RepID=A0AAV1C8M0_OLDCO|nr:OLC1v1027084C1 [Oldenlandia corymbosa var. corymbosa]